MVLDMSVEDVRIENKELEKAMASAAVATQLRAGEGEDRRAEGHVQQQ